MKQTKIFNIAFAGASALLALLSLIFTGTNHLSGWEWTATIFLFLGAAAFATIAVIDLVASQVLEVLPIKTRTLLMAPFVFVILFYFIRMLNSFVEIGDAYDGQGGYYFGNALVNLIYIAVIGIALFAYFKGTDKLVIFVASLAFITSPCLTSAITTFFNFFSSLGQKYVKSSYYLRSFCIPVIIVLLFAGLAVSYIADSKDTN